MAEILKSAEAQAAPPQSPPPPEPVPQSAPQPETAPQPEPAQRPAPRRSRLLPGVLLGAALTAVLAAVLLLTGVLTPGGTEATVDGPGFRTPEAAAAAYLEGLRDGDLDAMLAACTVERYWANLDRAAYLERYNAYVPNTMGCLDDNALAHALNVAQRRQELIRAMCLQYVWLTTPDPELLDTVMVLDGQSGASFLARHTNPQALELLASLEIGEPVDAAELLRGDMPEEGLRLEELYAHLNADAVEPVAIRVAIGGTPYVFCPNAVCYDGRWYLLQLHGTLATYLDASIVTGGLVPQAAG